MNDYYVYIYYRLDTNEPFYVGKGKAYRWSQLYNRGDYFKNIINKTEVVCEIIRANLTEEQSLGIECWLINELVFKYGYSIDIANNRSIEKGCHLVNQTWGGEGMSGHEPWNKGKNMSKEFKQKLSDANSGENNPNYGKHWSQEWRSNHSNFMKGRFIGTKNPFFKKHHTKETRRKISEKQLGKNNHRAKSVICITTKRIFFTAKEGAEYYFCDSSCITKCCRKKLKSCGKYNGQKLVWRYLIWKHNKKYRIKEEK